MKIIRQKTEIFKFNKNKELKRLKSWFQGAQLQRQLDILNALTEEKDLDKVQKLINSLPYDEEEECAEQEYVGTWVNIFTWSN